MVDNTESKRILTEKQQAFIEHLYGDAQGDFRKALRMAGYSESTKVSEVVNALRDELVEAGKNVFIFSGVEAAFKVREVMNNGNIPGAHNSLKAAQAILDRVGIVTKSSEGGDIRVDVSKGGVFILPAKEVPNYNDSISKSELSLED